MRELTPEEQAELDEMEVPFTTPSKLVRWDEELMRQLMSIVLNNTDMVRNIIEPDNFTNDIHKRACSIAYRFFDQYGQSPERAWVRNELTEAVSDKSEKIRFHYLAELSTVYEYYNPGIETAEAIVEKATNFHLMMSCKSEINKWIDSLRTGSPMSVSDFAARCDAIGINSATQSDTFNAMEFFDFAEQNAPEFLVDPYLQSGNLYLFSGESKAGKSTLTTSLTKSLVTGDTWFGHPCRQTPVVLVDLENPAYYISANLRQGFPVEKWANYSDKMHIVTSKPNVTVPWLKGLLKKRGLEKAVIIIDSARAAFEKQFAGVAGWENSASEVRKALQPISEFCHESGCTVILIHHHNKSGQTSGSTDWHAGVDFIWSYHKSGSQRTLAVEGRLVQEVPPLIFGFDPRKQGLYLEGTKSDVQQAKKDDRQADDIDQLLEAIPLGREQALLGKEINDLSPFSAGKTNKLLGELHRQCKVACENIKDGRSRGKIYWREKILA